jgi:hypothetical protein
MHADVLEGFLATKVVQGDDGKPRRVYVTRGAVCECGTGFTQRHLSARFLSMCEKWNGGGALRAVERQIPGFFVPVHCPKCERRDLQLEAKRLEYRALPDDYSQGAA